MTDLTPTVHQNEEGEANSAFGLRRWFRITPEDTGGAFCLFEEVIPEGEGPPLHVHKAEQELFTVLAGRVKFHCEGEEATVGAGATVLIPAGARHAFRGIGPGPSRVSVMLSPGRGEGFFRDVEAEDLSPEKDMDRIREIAEAYDLEFVGPPIG